MHGLAGTLDGRLLVAGSPAADPPGEVPEKPTSISEEDHEAHHGMPDNSAEALSDPLVRTVSIIDR